MYTSSFPWRGLDHEDIIASVFSGRRLLFPAHVPLPYRRLADACMAFEVANRPPCFADICQRLIHMRETC